MKKSRVVALVLASTGLSAFNVLAKQTEGFYIKPMLGVSQISDQNFTVQGSQGLDGNANASASSGIAAGLGIGYQITPSFSTELYWEYRSNDTDTNIDNVETSFTGNYASSIVYLNGYYHVIQNQDWGMYVGAGFGYVQEIDLDLEESGLERSFSDSGDTLLNLMLGFDYGLTSNVSLNAELRLAKTQSVDLSAEENVSGSATDLAYSPSTLAVGIKWRF